MTYTDAALQELKVCSVMLMMPHIVCHRRRVTQQFVGLPSRLRRPSCAGSTTGWQRCSHQCHRGDKRRSEERLFLSRATVSHTKKSLAENRFRLHSVCVCVWLIKGWVRLYSPPHLHMHAAVMDSGKGAERYSVTVKEFSPKSLPGVTSQNQISLDSLGDKYRTEREKRGSDTRAGRNKTTGPPK